jgi:hypothetical protein
MRGWVDFGAVKQTVSLEAVLRHYQVPGLRKRGRQLVGRCPIHRGQRDDSFRASLSKNAFHCFACQAGGNVLNFVAAMEKCSIRQAALRLQGWFSVGAPGEGRPLGSARRSVRNGELVREKEGRNPPLPFVLTGVDHSHPYLVERHRSGYGRRVWSGLLCRIRFAERAGGDPDRKCTGPDRGLRRSCAG